MLAARVARSGLGARTLVSVLLLSDRVAGCEQIRVGAGTHRRAPGGGNHKISRLPQAAEYQEVPQGENKKHRHNIDSGRAIRCTKVEYESPYESRMWVFAGI